MAENRICNTTKNRMVSLAADHCRQGCFLLEFAIMCNPGIAQNLLAKPTQPSLALKIPILIGASAVGRITKRMGCISNTQNRFPSIDIINDMLHVCIRQFTKAGKHYHKICAFKSFQTGDIIRLVGIDEPGYRINRKQHGAFVSMMLRKDLGKHAHPFLGSVILLTRYKNNVLAFAYSFFALDHKSGFCCTNGAKLCQQYKNR